MAVIAIGAAVEPLTLPTTVLFACVESWPSPRLPPIDESERLAWLTSRLMPPPLLVMLSFDEPAVRVDRTYLLPLVEPIKSWPSVGVPERAVPPFAIGKIPAT